MAFKKSSFIFFSCLVLAVSAFGADHFVTYQNGTDRMLMPCNLWYAGCAPTAASMVLGYWDNYGAMGGGNYGKYEQWGNLQRHYMDRNAARQMIAASGGTFTGGAIDGNTSLNYDLAYAMNTNIDGSTLYSDISPGINQAVTTLGYGGVWAESHSYYGVGAGIWQYVEQEVDAGRPFIWSASSDEVGHSIAGWGYTDSQYVIVYNTWDEMRHDYYYEYYVGVTGNPAVYMQIDTVSPQNGKDSDLRLVSPQGGELWYRNSVQEIAWAQTGTAINRIKIYYSADGGKTWLPGGEAPGSEGDNVFSWTVPDISVTNRMKIRIEGWYYGLIRYSGDGSRENFACVFATMTASPTASPTATITQTHTISPTFTVSPTITPTATVTPVFCMEVSGVFPNPAENGTRLVYTLCRESKVYLHIYNIGGELVRKMAQDGEPGENTLLWDFGQKAARGIYVYVIEAISGNDRQRKTGKIALK